MTAEYVATCDECGFTRTKQSAALADKSLGRHSCEFQRKLQARAQRVADRKNRSGPKVDCTCKNVRHEHGTLQAYKIDGCKCRPCLDANNKQSMTRTRKVAYGTWDSGKTDVAPVRDHIAMLIESGFSDRTIAEAANVGRTTIRAIMRGRKERGGQINKRTNKEVAERILALKPAKEILPDNCMVDATGTHRRLQALVAIGWPLNRLGNQLGVQASNMNTLLGQVTVRVRTAKKVRDLYDRSWNQTPATSNSYQAGAVKRAKTLATSNSYQAGAVKRAKTLAKRKGWVPPLAWDDDSIDDPAAQPDLGIKLKLRDTIAEDVKFLHSTGASREEIAERFGSSWETIERQLHRIERADIITLVKTDSRDNARQASKGHRAA
jgi:transposase